MGAAWDNAIAAGNAGGGGVKVAVLDTGVAYRTSPDRRYLLAPDLDRTRFVGGYDFVRNNTLPYDRNGHGTFVAGVIAQSTNNGIGLTGVAYRSRIMPIRVLDYEGKGDVATIARGIRFAARRGARVINMSFEFDIGLTSSEIPDVLSAVRYAHRKGAVMVAAAGNTEETRIAYPARARQVIAVGATTEHGCVADYSNSGNGLDLVAPGGGADAFIDTDANCKPLEDPGRDVYQFTFRGVSPRKFGLPSGYEGTSMAVPHVSGTIALMLGARTLGARPSPEAITSRLESTARDLGPPGYDQLYGWGLLNAAAATAPRAAAARRRSAELPDSRLTATVVSNDQHRARCVVRDLVRDAAQQEPLGAGHALVADDDQVRLLLVGDVEDHVRRLSLPRIGAHRDAGRLGLLGGLGERGVDILAGVHRVLDVGGRLEALLAQPRCGHRVVRAHDVERCSSLLRQLGRLAHGLLGGLRAVRSDHDPREHLPSSEESGAPKAGGS